ncbi:MAG: calcium/sodium antiporter [Planctomycetota bacterium]|jgi:cation:H+ antiporter
MNIFWAIVLLVAGLLILWKAADLLVSGAVALAERLGISPLVIGLTVVAMGTSAPEVAASIAAAVRGQGDVAIGNVYGSNIANLALVGGLAAMIRPLAIQKQTLRYQIPVMLLVALLLWPILNNLDLARIEGLLLLAVFAALILLTVYLARRQKLNATAAQGQDDSGTGRDMKKAVLFVVIGLAGLGVGADITVRGAVFIGDKIGLSKAVIGLTIIAIGTSLPELATCVVAAIKGQHDISIGNLVGSNVFNTLLVVGTAGAVRPFGIVQRLAATDYWIMIVVSAGFAALAILGRRVINRLSAVVLLTGYAAFIVYLLAYNR